jgi:hypothetical protein
VPEIKKRLREEREDDYLLPVSSARKLRSGNCSEINKFS